MDYSTFLARVLGLYLIILSLAIFINKDSIKNTINGIIQNSSLQFIIGLNMVVFGLLLVLTHNLWIWSWQVGVTIISWLILIKGILYIASPNTIRKMSGPFLISGKFSNIAIVINLLIGIYFCYYGFIAS